MHFRVLTKEERVIEGLSSGKDAPLEVRQGGIAGRGVFAKEPIGKGSWLCEYKTTSVFKRSEKERVANEYDANNEGSYIVESANPVGGEGYLCFDATRKYHQLGRYMNHARSPNAVLTQPFLVRGKWRVGFVAVRDIDEGDEVVWDYKIGGEVWSGCRLVGGVVKQTREMEVESNEGKETDCAVIATTTRPPKRRLCYCPVEGCSSKPLTKLSNHLAQVHHLNPQQRAKYLWRKRVFASSKDVVGRVKRTVLRKSQRTLPTLNQYFRTSSESESENYTSVSSLERDMPENSSGPSGVSGLEITDLESEDGCAVHEERGIQDCETNESTSSAECVEQSSLQLTGEATSSGKCAEASTSRRGRTDAAGRFQLDSPFLVNFADYLVSCIGGKKKPSQVTEICMEVSKYLWFANSEALDPEALLSRSMIRKFVSEMESEGVGPSRMLTKLRRLLMAIRCQELSCEDLDTENDVLEKARSVQNMISQLCIGLGREKAVIQSNKLDSFAQKMPDL